MNIQRFKRCRPTCSKDAPTIFRHTYVPIEFRMTKKFTFEKGRRNTLVSLRIVLNQNISFSINQAMLPSIDSSFFEFQTDNHGQSESISLSKQKVVQSSTSKSDTRRSPGNRSLIEAKIQYNCISTSTEKAQKIIIWIFMTIKAS